MPLKWAKSSPFLVTFPIMSQLREFLQFWSQRPHIWPKVPQRTTLSYRTSEKQILYKIFVQGFELLTILPNTKRVEKQFIILVAVCIIFPRKKAGLYIVQLSNIVLYSVTPKPDKQVFLNIDNLWKYYSPSEVVHDNMVKSAKYGKILRLPASNVYIFSY